MRQERRAGERQVADGVQRLVAHELVRVAQALGVDDACRRRARPCCRARRRARSPAFQSRSTSRMKPKVRARAMSGGKRPGSRSRTFFWRPISGVSKSISTSRRKPRAKGRSSAKARPCSTRTGFRTLMERRLADWRTRPARSIASTKGAALPSMIGTSGPSISTRTLSTPRPARAARRCSMVATEPVAVSPMMVQSSVALTASCRASMSRSRPPSRPVRRKVDAGVDIGRMEDDPDGGARVDADARQFRAVAQGRLLLTSHHSDSTLHPQSLDNIVVLQCPCSVLTRPCDLLSLRPRRPDREIL